MGRVVMKIILELKIKWNVRCFIFLSQICQVFVCFCWVHLWRWWHAFSQLLLVDGDLDHVWMFFMSNPSWKNESYLTSTSYLTNVEHQNIVVTWRICWVYLKYWHIQQDVFINDKFYTTSTHLKIHLDTQNSHVLKRHTFSKLIFGMCFKMSEVYPCLR